MTEIVAKPKVFFSYSYGDRAWAQRFAGALTESGITVWAGDVLSNGNHLVGALEAGLKESDTVVILFDAETLQNANALFELGAAMAGDKAVVPVVPPGVNVSRLPVPLRRVVFLAAQLRRGPRWPPRHLRRLPGREDQPATRPGCRYFADMTRVAGV